MSSGTYSDSSDDGEDVRVERRSKESNEKDEDRRKRNEGMTDKIRRRRRSSLESDDGSRSRSPEESKTVKRSRSKEKPCKKRSESRDRDGERSKSRSGSADRTERRSRSRSRSREQYRHGKRYWDDDRYSDRRSIERRRRRSREDRSRGNSDIYWNKYGDRRSDRSKGARRDDDEDGERKRERRDPENRDPNVGTRPGGSEMKEGGVKDQEPSAKRVRKTVDEGAEALTLRTGGAYIPPARLRMMQAELTDKSSIAYQRFAWEALKKSINGLINKVNVANMDIICREIMKENVVRGRGLLARAIMQAQAASPTFTHVYAALVCILNSKFPQFGELVLTRLIIQFRRGFRRNDKNICLSATKFVAHLANQEVAHEVVALEILTLLLENATDDSVEVAVGFLKECGAKLTEVSPRGIHAIFERLRSILHEGLLDKRVQYMIEVVFAVRKDGFKDHPVIADGLDKVDEADRITHLISLDEATDGQDMLNVFKHEPAYEENEEKYKAIRNEILGEDSSDDSDAGTGDEEETDSEEDEDGEGEGKDQTIIDSTETNLAAFRRVVYLTIHSSLDYEECVHKLLKMEQKPGQEVEVCHMILDCCAQQRSYEKFYGLLAQRFCQLSRSYVEPFESIFRDTYDTIHRLEVNKMRNVAKVFAHLLFTDAISWGVLGHIKLNEDDTTSSSRIVIKVIFQELAEYMGLPKLNERVKDPTLQEAFAGLFPRDNPVNTRFAINFFTSIGLGGLTDELREHLKSMPKVSAVRPPPPESSAASSSSSSSSEEEDNENSISSSSSSEDEKKGRKKEKSKHVSSKKQKRKAVKSREKEVKHSSSRRKTVSKSSSSTDSSSEESDESGNEDHRRMVDRRRPQEDTRERERKNDDVRERERDDINTDLRKRGRDRRNDDVRERERGRRNDDVWEREKERRKEDLRERGIDEVRESESERRREDVRERYGEHRINDMRERERRNDDAREKNRDRRNEDVREKNRVYRNEGSSYVKRSDRR